MMSVEEIWKVLPHRYPILLIDRIEEVEGSQRIVAVKNVTINEPFFEGHFPGRPIMPGVLICEAMAQVGAILAHQVLSPLAKGKVAVLTGLDGVKFKKPVVPGDRLRLELTCLRHRSPMWKMKGVATVDGKVVAVAEITAMEIDMGGILFR